MFSNVIPSSKMLSRILLDSKIIKSTTLHFLFHLMRKKKQAHKHLHPHTRRCVRKLMSDAATLCSLVKTAASGKHPAKSSEAAQAIVFPPVSLHLMLETGALALIQQLKTLTEGSPFYRCFLVLEIFQLAVDRYQIHMERVANLHRICILR